MRPDRKPEEFAKNNPEMERGNKVFSKQGLIHLWTKLSVFKNGYAKNADNLLHTRLFAAQLCVKKLPL